jgi:hypothetical protein
VNFARTYLLAQPDIAAIVGDGIYPLFIPQGREPPCIVYQQIDAARQVTYDGTNNLVGASVQFDCLAKKYADARTLADAVRGALTDFTGSMAGTTVKNCFVVADQDLSDIEPGFFRVSLNFDLWYIE